MTRGTQRLTVYNHQQTLSPKGLFAAIKKMYGPHKTDGTPVREYSGSQVCTQQFAIVSRQEYVSEPNHCHRRSTCFNSTTSLQDDMANPPALEKCLGNMAVQQTHNGCVLWRMSKRETSSSTSSEIPKCGGQPHESLSCSDRHLRIHRPEPVTG